MPNFRNRKKQTGTSIFFSEDILNDLVKKINSDLFYGKMRGGQEITETEDETDTDQDEIEEFDFELDENDENPAYGIRTVPDFEQKLRETPEADLGNLRPPVVMTRFARQLLKTPEAKLGNLTPPIVVDNFNRQLLETPVDQLGDLNVQQNITNDYDRQLLETPVDQLGDLDPEDYSKPTTKTPTQTPQMQQQPVPKVTESVPIEPMPKLTISSSPSPPPSSPPPPPPPPPPPLPGGPPTSSLSGGPPPPPPKKVKTASSAATGGPTGGPTGAPTGAPTGGPTAPPALVSTKAISLVIPTEINSTTLDTLRKDILDNAAFNKADVAYVDVENYTKIYQKNISDIHKDIAHREKETANYTKNYKIASSQLKYAAKTGLDTDIPTQEKYDAAEYYFIHQKILQEKKLQEMAENIKMLEKMIALSDTIADKTMKTDLEKRLADMKALETQQQPIVKKLDDGYKIFNTNNLEIFYKKTANENLVKEIEKLETDKLPLIADIDKHQKEISDADSDKTKYMDTHLTPLTEALKKINDNLTVEKNKLHKAQAAKDATTEAILTPIIAALEKDKLAEEAKVTAVNVELKKITDRADKATNEIIEIKKKLAPIDADIAAKQKTIADKKVEIAKLAEDLDKVIEMKGGNNSKYLHNCYHRFRHNKTAHELKLILHKIKHSTLFQNFTVPKLKAYYPELQNMPDDYFARLMIAVIRFAILQKNPELNARKHEDMQIKKIQQIVSNSNQLKYFLLLNNKAIIEMFVNYDRTLWNS